MTTPNTAAQNAAAIAAAAIPLLGPKAQLALTIASIAINAVQAAQTRGEDVSDEELSKLFDAYAMASAANAAAARVAVD